MSRLPLQVIVDQYENHAQLLTQETNTKELIKLSKKTKHLQHQADLAQQIIEAEKRTQDNQELLAEFDSQDEMYMMAQEEIAQDAQTIIAGEEELLGYLAPADPRDDYDVYLEIRAGAGGDEASLFVGEMLRMYGYLADQVGAKLTLSSVSENSTGGYKEVIAEVKGDQPYSWFKYEGGVHRVQRVPATEKQGRIHTSTVSVAIMPLIERDNDFKLNMDEVEIIISTSSGKGGQSVNTTYSAVRMLHKPTGMEAQSQDERSQIQNREKCIQVLTSRVYNYYEELRMAEETAERRSQVGKADRSEKIRTYNFPQDRLTDHRYNKNYSNLPGIMDGNITSILKDIRKMEAESVLDNLNN